MDSITTSKLDPSSFSRAQSSQQLGVEIAFSLKKNRTVFEPVTEK